MPFAIKYVFRFPLVIAKLLGDYFDTRGYSANRTFELMTLQLVRAPNVQSVKGKTRKNPRVHY